MNFYESDHDMGRIGAFCIPKDESLKKELLANANLDSKNLFMNSIDVIKLCMLIAIGLALIYMVLVQCCAKMMTKFVPILACVVLLGLGISLFIYPSESPLKIPIAIAIIIMLLVLVCSYCEHRKDMELFGIFMNHGTKMLGGSKCCTFLYILLFWVCTLGFLALLVFEFKCFWGGGNLTFDKEKSVYWEFEGAGSTILTVLLVIQAYWGLNFLK